MSIGIRAAGPARLCQTCLLRQSVSVESSTRWLHTSRPVDRNPPKSAKPSFKPPPLPSPSVRSRPPANSKGRSPAFRRDARQPLRMSVDDFKPTPPPRPTRIAQLLSSRIGEWASSVRTAKQLEAYGLDATTRRRLLRNWEKDVFNRLKGIRDDNEATTALVELGFDRRRLTLAVADDNFSETLEAAYSRHFLQSVIRLPDLPASVGSHISTILKATDISRLPNQFSYTPARALTRHFHLHIGPTNSGKTYSALKALSRAKTGAYAGPLRLLAHEVWERMNLGTVGGMEEGKGRECNLLTGEERRIVSPDAGLISCTVEMLPLGAPMGAYDVVVIDEIQMLGDPQRGGSWTAAVLGVQANEIHLCGDETTVQLLHDLLEPLGDKITVNRYDRLTPLTVADESLDGDWTNIQPGDCVVTFSRSNIFSVKRQIESTAGRKCAVVYGALPPETRADQARDFNDENGKAEVLVASDAVGMGLNLKINRMIFEALHKFNGKEEVPLALTQIKQIAGRAGRFGMQRTATDGTDPAGPDEVPAPGGAVTTLNAADLPILKSLLPLPLPPITRAVLDIPHDTLAALSALLPADTTFAELLEHVSALAVLPANTVLSTNRHRVQLADAIEHLRDSLTLKEMETFSFAPVNQRDTQSVSILEAVVTAFAHEGRVDLMELYEGKGLIENLETAEKTLKSLPPVDAAPASSGDHPFTPPVIVNAIPALETLHKSLVMYIWLSFRFDVSLPDRPLAVSIKERVEKVLDQCLARLPGLRQKKKHTKDRSRRAATNAPAGQEHRTAKKQIEYASKGEDQARKLSQKWRHIGVVAE